MLQGFPSLGCKFQGRQGSFCCMKKGPENRQNEVKLRPLKHSVNGRFMLKASGNIVILKPGLQKCVG